MVHPVTAAPTLLAQLSSTGDILQRGIDFVSTPQGILGIVGFAVLAGSAVFSPRGWRLPLLLTLLLSTLIDGSTEYFQNILFPPLQQVREANQLLVVAMLALIAVATRRFPPFAGAVGGVLAALFCFELFYALRTFLGGQYLKGALATMTYLLLMAAMPLGIGRALRDGENAERLVRTVGMLAIPYLACNALQFAYSPSFTVHGGRFSGISGNAQAAAMIASVQTVAIAWMLSRPRKGTWMLPMLVGLVGAMAVLLIWTGSRTGMLSTIVGVTILFRRRIAAFVVVIGIAGAVAVAFASALGEVEGSFERLGSTDNTRAEVWLMGMEEFAERPIFGTFGLGETRDVKVIESTIIQTLQTMGIVALPLLLWVYGAIGMAMLRLHRLAREHPERGAMADFSLAVWGMLLVMSLFEAVFLGITTFFALILYVNGMLTARLLNPEPFPLEHDGEEEPAAT
jgi:hypothetical protein